MSKNSVILDKLAVDKKTDLPNGMEKKYEIWLAEDDLDDVELFKAVILSNNQAFSFQHFPDGIQLLESLNERKKKFDQSLPDLIVLDQFMPLKSGWDILETIKLDQELKNVVVIMMSGTYTQDNIDNGYRMGMDGYIQKPVFIGEWKSIIDKLIATWKSD
jgi:two-component system response regulator